MQVKKMPEIIAIVMMTSVVIIGFLIFWGWLGYGIIKDSTSSQIPQAIESKINIENMPAGLPREIKYFSVSTDAYKNPGWVLQYSFKSDNLIVYWSTATNYPGKDFTLYHPVPDSFNIQGDVFLFTWERVVRNLAASIFILLLIPVLPITALIFIAKIYLKQGRN